MIRPAHSAHWRMWSNISYKMDGSSVLRHQFSTFHWLVNTKTLQIKPIFFSFRNIKFKIPKKNHFQNEILRCCCCFNHCVRCICEWTVFLLVLFYSVWKMKIFQFRLWMRKYNFFREFCRPSPMSKNKSPINTQKNVPSKHHSLQRILQSSAPIQRLLPAMLKHKWVNRLLSTHTHTHTWNTWPTLF